MPIDVPSRGQETRAYTRIFSGEYPSGGLIGSAVPSGFIYVATSIDMINTDHTAGDQIEIFAYPLTVGVAGGEVQSGQPWWFYWRGELVLSGGEQFEVNAATGDWFGSINGYYLIQPEWPSL